MTGIFGGFVGCVVFLVAALDNPFRGEISVSSEAYVQLQTTLVDLDPATQQSPVP